MGTIINGFSQDTTGTLTDILGISGPSGSTVTYESVAGGSSSGSAPGLDLTETMGAGHADTAGNSTADNLGTFPSNGAVHDGTSTPAPGQCQG